MTVVWFQNECPPWLGPIADKLGVLVTNFDPRSITTRNDPFVVLLDAREEDPVALAQRARTAFGAEAVLVALTGLEGISDDALRLVDVAAPAATHIVLPVVRLALTLATERRKSRTAESRLAHLKHPLSERLGLDLGGGALAAARLGVVMFDAELRCVVWNRFMEQRLGVVASAVLGKQLTSGALALPLHDLAARALAGESIDTGETRTTDPSTGAVLWLHVIANPIYEDGHEEPRGVAAVVRDLTPQRVAEELRHQTEREFRSLLDALPEGGVVHIDGKIAFANKTIATLTRRSDPASVIGKAFVDLFSPEDRILVEAHVRGTIEGQRMSAQELRLLRHDGGMALVEMTSAVVHFDGRLGVFSVARDVTERKELQEHIATSDRLVSMGVLAAGVAHEINNPLTALVSSLEFLDEEIEALVATRGAEAAPASSEDLHDLLLTSKEATYRIRDIVRDLRLFTRPNEHRRTLVDLRETLDSTARLARVEIRHRARLVKDFKPVPLVFGNEARLGQVFLNLVMNAAHAIAEGDVERNEITLATDTDERGYAVIEVRDTGRGIPASVLPHIFEPFFTTKPVGVGTGLGLSISRRIIQSKGGQLEAISEEGSGATFRVTLPPAPEARLQAQVVETERSEPAKRGRLLVVDDDVAVRRALIRILGDAHEVLTVSSGAEAIELVVEGERFDVVLCDLMMPRVTGDQCWERVNEISPEQAARFVFMTGGAFTPSARGFLEKTQLPLLEKPFDLVLLRSVVNDLLALPSQKSGDL